MKIQFAIVFVAILAGISANSDYIIDHYTEMAIEELHEMNRNKGERGFMGITGPDCKVHSNNDSINCCIGMMWMGHKRTICLDLAFIPDRLELQFRLSFDGEEILSQTLAVGEVCVPLPGMLSKLGICVDAYYLHIDTKKPRISFEACFLIKIAGILHINFNCMNLDKNGKFSHRHDQSPDKHGTFEISLEDGKMKMNVHNPIPPEVMDKLGQGWKQFEHETNTIIEKTMQHLNNVGETVQREFDRSVVKLKDELNKHWNSVSGTFKGMGHTIANWFG